LREEGEKKKKKTRAGREKKKRKKKGGKGRGEDNLGRSSSTLWWDTSLPRAGKGGEGKKGSGGGGERKGKKKFQRPGTIHFSPENRPWETQHLVRKKKKAFWKGGKRKKGKCSGLRNDCAFDFPPS